MKRRTLLGTVGVGITAIAGCLSRVGTDSFSTDMQQKEFPDPNSTSVSTDMNASDNTSEDDTIGTESIGTESSATDRRPNQNARERVASGKQKQVTVGDPSVSDRNQKPHGVVLSNATDKMWVATLTIRTYASGTEREGQSDSSVVLDTTYELEAQASVAVSITEPRQYAIEVTIPKRGTLTTAVSQSRFDCNHSSTNITIQPNGSLEMTTVSTQMACPSG